LHFTAQQGILIGQDNTDTKPMLLGLWAHGCSRDWRGTYSRDI